MKTIAFLAAALVAASSVPLAGAEPSFSVTILSPGDGDVVGWLDGITAEYRSPNLLSPLVHVEVLADGASIGVWYVPIDYATPERTEFTLSTNLSELGEGLHSLQLLVRDAAIGPTEFSQTVTVYVVDAPVPALRVERAAFLRGALVVDALAETWDGEPARFDLSVGESHTNATTAGGAQLRLALPDLAPGSHVATLNVTDAQGNHRETSVPFVAVSEVVVFDDVLYAGAGYAFARVPPAASLRVYACYFGDECEEFSVYGAAQVGPCRATSLPQGPCEFSSSATSSGVSIEYALASESRLLITRVLDVT